MEMTERAIPFGHEFFHDISPNTVGASSRSDEEDPNALMKLFRELVRSNDALALQILKNAWDAQAAGRSAEDAAIIGAMSFAGIIVRHFRIMEIEPLFHQSSDSEIPDEATQIPLFRMTQALLETTTKSPNDEAAA